MVNVIFTAFIVILSALFRGISTKRGTIGAALANVGLGLPADLTFALIAVVIIPENLKECFQPWYAVFTAGILIAYALQLALYCKTDELRYEKKVVESGFCWFANLFGTVAIYISLIWWVVVL